MENQYNFVEYKSFGSRTGTIYVGITANGTISFYSGFCRQHNLSNFKKCIILYDKKSRVIGFQFGGEDLGDGSFPVNFDDNRKMAWIGARTNFFKLNPELDPKKLKGRYIPTKYRDPERKNVFVISLAERVN